MIKKVYFQPPNCEKWGRFVNVNQLLSNHEDWFFRLIISQERLRVGETVVWEYEHSGGWKIFFK